MKRERIEKAVEVINYAIKHSISVKEASVKCGYANTYVKNVKAILKEKYGEHLVDDDLFLYFMDKYEEYLSSRGSGEDVKDMSTDTTKSKRVKGESTSLDVKGNVADANWKGDKEHFDEFFNNNQDQYKDDLDGDGVVFGYPKGHIKTLDELLDRCNVDKDIWDVDHYLVNKWDVTSWKNGGPETWENFQVKAKLKLRESEYKAKLAGKIFQRMTENYKPPVVDWDINKKHIDSEENNIFEVALFDLHFGKLAWNGETGENFDTKIAEKRFIYALKKLIKRSQGFSYNRILFPIGNDFFNSDTIENTTTSGTQQDEDLRWQKTFEAGCKLIVDGVNMLKQLGMPIDILIIPGNHDFERSFYLGSYISAWFRNDSQISINNAAKPRKYYRWGKVLLGFTHGRDEKESSLPMLMAKDRDSKKHWSETDFHEWHLGHFHRKKTKQYTVLDKTNYTDEEDGVIIRYLSSLTGTEEWHFKKGFVGQIKAGEGFIWNDRTGLIGHVNSNYIYEGMVEEENDIDDLINMQ